MSKHQPESFDEWCDRTFLAHAGYYDLSSCKEAYEAGQQSILKSEVERLRDLAGTVYAGLGAECDLPEQWLDVLLAAANGEPFTVEGLLPYSKAK